MNRRKVLQGIGATALVVSLPMAVASIEPACRYVKIEHQTFYTAKARLMWYRAEFDELRKGDKFRIYNPDGTRSDKFVYRAESDYCPRIRGVSAALSQ